MTHLDFKLLFQSNTDHRMKTSALCFLYKIYHRVGHPLHEYLHSFIPVRNTRA